MTTAESSAGPTFRMYVAVWLGMIAIAAVEAWLAYMHVSPHMLLAALLVLAVVEAGVALRYFMHLKYEVPLLFWTLIPALVFAFVMMNQFWADSARMNSLRFPVP